MKDETGIQLSENDLLAQCEAEQCAVYLNVDGVKGHCPKGLRDEYDDWFVDVYGVGKGQVINPRALIESAGVVEIQLYISGEVRQIERFDAEKYESAEWLATFPRERCHLIFAQSEIAVLAQIIKGAAPSLERTKPSHLLTIAVLLELLKEKGRPVYTLEAIVLAISERYGEESDSPVLGLGSSNIKDIFAEANKAIPGAKRKNPKSQLQ